MIAGLYAIPVVDERAEGLHVGEIAYATPAVPLAVGKPAIAWLRDGTRVIGTLAAGVPSRIGSAAGGDAEPVVVMRQRVDGSTRTADVEILGRRVAAVHRVVGALAAIG